MHIHDLLDQKMSLHNLGIGDFPLEHTLERCLQQEKPNDWRATTITREDYLRIAERIARAAAEWIDDKGAVIDPVIQREWAQTTPRFCATVASLIACSRAEDLTPLLYRSLDYACARLSQKEVRESSPDFWMRDLTWSIFCLRDKAPNDKIESWKRALAAVEPEAIYTNTDPSHTKLKEFHNWAVFSSAGEACREALGIGAQNDFLYGDTFFDTYMAGQFHRITENGMYRDPNDPFTYDITTRLQFTIPLLFGYDGKFRAACSEIERRGAISTLLYCSPEGFVPFGGRSSQFQFQEGLCAAMFEIEARRYKKTNPQLAGAFKRQAHLATQAVLPWIFELEPLRHIKNSFDPKTRHGCDTYGHYSVYSLVAGTMFGIAAVLADDEIVEHPAPAETGGYTVLLQPAFHKIIATCAGNYIEIDPAAQKGQDATGLGRILLKGKAYNLLPSMPCAKEPKYVIASEEAEKQSQNSGLACGPEWTIDSETFRLADFTDEFSNWSVAVQEESVERVQLSIAYQLAGNIQIHESFILDKDGLDIHCQVRKDNQEIAFEYLLPILDNDGTDQATCITQEHNENSCALHYKKSTCAITSNAAIRKDNAIRCGNRSGIYTALRFASNADGCKLSIKR